MRHLALMMMCALLIFVAAPVRAQTIPTSICVAATVQPPFEGATDASVNGINDWGWMVGSYYDGGRPRGFLAIAGSFTRLDVPLPGVRSTVPRGVNEDGVIVGTYDDGVGHGFILENGVYTTFDVPVLGAVATELNGINASGTIVGTYYLSESESRGFLVEGGDFKPLDLPFEGVLYSRADAINDHGVVVGTYGTATWHAAGFVRDAEGRFSEPPVHPEMGYRRLRGINNRGDMVGGMYLYRNGAVEPVPVFYPEKLELRSYGGDYNDIDNLGRVVGFTSVPQFNRTVSIFGFVGLPSPSLL